MLLGATWTRRGGTTSWGYHRRRASGLPGWRRLGLPLRPIQLGQIRGQRLRNRKKFRKWKFSILGINSNTMSVIFVETYISSISSIIHIESKQAMLQYRSHCAMLNKTLSWFFFFSFSLLFSWWEPTPCPMTAAAAAWHPVNELRRRWWIWWTSSACNTRGKQAFSWIKKMYCKAQSL